MALLDNIRSELQLDITDISDADIAYVISQTGDNINLACAHTLRLVINKNKGRRQLTIGSFNESVDVRELRKQMRTYMAKASITGYGEIEDNDVIFAMDGI